MIINLLRPVLFLYWICFYSEEVFGEPYFRSIRNVAFDSQKLLENKIRTTHAASVMVCSNLCAADPTCRSLNYNKQLGTCDLFDSDFIDVALTATQTEDGWLYYYLIRDYDKSLRYRCVSTAPTSDICSMYCLHFIYNATAASYEDFASICSQLDGGEMVKVDRELKQHCMEDYLVNVTGYTGRVYIQGKRDDVTGTWKYDDGTNIVYSNWNTLVGQPEDLSTEPYIVVRIDLNFLWHDNPGSNVYGVICQQG